MPGGVDGGGGGAGGDGGGAGGLGDGGGGGSGGGGDGGAYLQMHLLDEEHRPVLRAAKTNREDEETPLRAQPAG